MNDKCPIWGTPAQLLESAGDYRIVDSSRAGGKYWISGTAIGEVSAVTEHAKRLLTTWLCEQRGAGVQTPKVQTGAIAITNSRQPLLIMTRMTRALEYLGTHIRELGQSLTFEVDSYDAMRLVAETESKNLSEAMQLFRMLEESGLVKATFVINGVGRFQPTVQGWRALDDLRKPQKDSSQAFVAMWFDDSTIDIYAKGIEPALKTTGYNAVRIDKKEHNNKIDDEIIAEIRRSKFLIADFTCEPKKVRGGVYYEAGFAQGLGIPVIWTCKKTSLNDLHFDTRQYSHIVWSTPEDLFRQLKNRIGATIGEGPLPKV